MTKRDRFYKPSEMGWLLNGPPYSSSNQIKERSMDPNSTLKTFIESLIQCDHEITLAAHTELSDWLYKGGFEPDWNAAHKRLFENFNPKTGLVEMRNIS